MKDVKTKGKVVDTIELAIYDTLAEIQADHEDAKIVALFNKAFAVDEMGSSRNKHAPSRIGKSKKMRMAYNMLTPDEALSCAQDYDKLQALLESKLPEVEKALAAQEAE